MRTRWYTFALGALTLSLAAWTAAPALAQHGHGGGGGGHGGGGWGGGHGGSWNGGHDGHGGGWGGVGIYLGGYPRYGYGGGYGGYYGDYGYSYPAYPYYDNSYAYPDYSYTDNNAYQSYYPPQQQYNNQPAGPTQTVTITDGGFSPKTLNVSQGTTVRFNNQGQQQHGLAQPHQNWKSNNLSPGQSYTWTFTEPGTYDLQDSMNPNNRITVTVQ